MTLANVVFLLVSVFNSSGITKNFHEVWYWGLLSLFPFYIQLLSDWYCM